MSLTPSEAPLPAAATQLVQAEGHDQSGLPSLWRTTHDCDGRPVERVVWRVNTADFLNGVATEAAPELPTNFHIVSSVPDVSEVRPRLTPLEYEVWCANVVERMLDLLPPGNVCILYQTPGRYSAEGGAWPS